MLVSRDYAPYGRRRDARVAAALGKDGVSLEALPGQLIAEPEQVQTKAGRCYSVFSPYHRTWLVAARRTVLPAPDAIAGVHGLESGVLPSLAEVGGAGAAAQLIPAGEAAARSRLAAWSAPFCRRLAFHLCKGR